MSKELLPNDGEEDNFWGPAIFFILFLLLVGLIILLDHQLSQVLKFITAEPFQN